jgi:hypothetical protein
MENPCDFMGGGSDGLGSAQLGSHAPKELTEVAFGGAEGVGKIMDNDWAAVVAPPQPATIQ